MHKRHFLHVAALAAGALPTLSQAHNIKPPKGPVLLTITGAIGRPNRGPFDPALDQIMGKQKISFTKAFGFDFASLATLPAHTIKPTLEYDAKAHVLRGPALVDVLGAAGAQLRDDSRVVLSAVDGYAVTQTLAQLRSQRFLVATHMDGIALPLGGLGPLWAVVDADRLPDLAAKPLAERFGACPWALYHIDLPD